MSIVTLKLPPLRERVEDIPVLVKLFVEKHASGRPIVVTKEALRALTSFAWPGNVRQLENEVRRAIVLGDGTIDLEHLSPEIAAPARAAPVDLGLDVKRRVDRLESDLVREALGRTHNNQTKAAQLLGLSRFGLQKMMKRLAIKAS
jgi:DNA-binding NtrC family response regulator